MTLPDARIYPPFKLNKKEANTHLFSEVEIPVGTQTLTQKILIPTHAVKGLTTDVNANNVGEPLSGIRVDCSQGVELDKLIANLLATIRLYTYQWWLSLQRNPFDAGIRMSFHLEPNFSPGDVPLVRGRRRGPRTRQGLDTQD
jgi:hypothetical protein